MNLRRADAEAYADRLRRDLPDPPPGEVVLFPPFTLLPVVAQRLAGSSIAWGGQDLHPEDAGAHTGDVSALHLTDWGASWVLCGHSERRAEHGESDAQVAAKVAQAQRRGLVTPALRRRDRRRARGGSNRDGAANAARRGAAARRQRALGPRLRAGLGHRHRADRDPRSGPGGARPAAGGGGGAPRRPARPATCGSSTAGRSSRTTPRTCSPGPTSTVS